MRYEGEQAKVSAEAQAVVRIAQADAEAGATVVANPTVISYEASHHWNSKLPGTMLGGTTSPLSMFNIQPGQPASGGTPTAAAAAPGHTSLN